MSDRAPAAGAPPAPNRNTLWAGIFVEELHRAGVRTACLSPGSRSTPLVMAFAAHGGFTLYSLIDERGGGFFALGHAKAADAPVALVCTSGTAAANYYPAVIEAFHGEVPLIVLTADRPPELRDAGAGQTIDQLKLYGSAVKWFCEVGTPETSEEALRRLRALAGRAVFEAVRPPAGPVHLNFPFRKPLEPTPLPDDLPATLEQAHPVTLHGRQGEPYGRGHRPWAVPAPEAILRATRLVRAAPRGLIVCGPLPPRPADEAAAHWPQAVAELARLTGYPVLAEPPSQLRAGPHDKSAVIAHGEAILRAPEFRARLRPELILRFGGFPTARHVEVLLEEHPACPVVLVHPGGRWLEPTHHPTDLVTADPTEFCRALAEALGPGVPGREAGWLEAFRRADRLAAEAIGETFRRAPPEGLGEGWFEGRVFAELAALLPEGALLCTASSMPVRDLDAFTPLTEQKVWHLVHRGANGIDGTLSAALGAAAAHRERGPTALVTGDLAFYHDSNGLLAAKRHSIPLTVILLNNEGGGIFEMLPVAAFDPPFEEHFATPHGIDFRALAAAYGIELARPADWVAFRAAVREGLSGGATRVIEIRTERKANRDHHRRIWEAVAARLRDLPVP